MADESPSQAEQLRQLALDLRWSWNHTADELWHQLDPELWARTHNAWVVLQTVSRGRLSAMLAEPQFRDRLEQVTRTREVVAHSPAWFATEPASGLLGCAAYFSMEFMLSDALPIYAGGLGNVAGDQMKAASDLGVPVVGVGLLYQQGYFRQVIDRDGGQHALYPYNDPDQLPLTPLRTSDGEWVRVTLDFPGGALWLRGWLAQVGRVRLYLLDSNDAANYPAYRGITSELYGGGPELRLQQELALGIGGWRLLRALGLRPEVCHLNEGHAAFAVLERARACMEDTGHPFDTALTITRAGNLFTTHTAVPAGFDRFDPQLIERYLGTYARERLRIPLDQLLALGRNEENGSSLPFNMAWLAVHGSGAVNAVSRLHAQVSRRIFLPLFPRWPVQEVPVGHITNGIHAPSWDSRSADALWTEACGRGRWQGTLEEMPQRVRRIPDEAIWQARTEARRELIAFARERLTWQLGASGVAQLTAEESGRVLDPQVLTLGFARRFATYKRPNLLLHDPQRLARLLTNREKPVQLILAGKAHPADSAGQALIREWVQFVRHPDMRPHAIFLADYDMRLTEWIVGGVDVWINTPRRPWEACGTSGMKVLVNGGLNLSELDGWWAEAYESSVGWALGDGQSHDEDPAWDAAEAEQLYRLLEEQIVPQFYTRDAQGIPRAWVARVRESMARLAPEYSANRSVREYTQRCYLPAAQRYRERAQDGGALGTRIAAALHRLARDWAGVRFGAVDVRTIGDTHHFSIEVELGELEADAVRVELYAEADGGAAGSAQPMTLRASMPGASSGIRASGGEAPPQRRGALLYEASVPASRPVAQYTPRIVAACEGAVLPLEAPFILWQH